MKSRFLYFCLALLSGCGAADAAGKIKKIQIEGLKLIAQDAVLARIESRVGSDFSPVRQKADEQAILAMGYFSGVTSKSDPDPVDQDLVLTFVVAENPVVTAILLPGAKSVSSEKILPVLRSKIGRVFNLNDPDADARAIRDFYREEGYVAILTDPPQISPQGALTISFVEAVIGDIKISGLTKTKQYVVRREMKTKPGDVYNINKLQKDLQRIYNLDYFESLNPKVDLIPGPEPGRLLIDLEVVEKKTGYASVGAGYSSRDKVVGRAELNETNFQGKGRGLQLYVENGGLASTSSFNLSYYEPWLTPRKDSLRVSLYNRVQYRFTSELIGGQSEESRYYERHKGASLTLSKPTKNEELRYSLTFRGETVQTRDIEDYSPPPDFLKQNGKTNSLALRSTLDSRDYFADPASGRFTQYGLEYGVADLTTIGNKPFTKLTAEWRRYWTLGKKRKDLSDKVRVVAGRVHLGITNEDIPFFEQFFLGGAENLRGYQVDRFWGSQMLLMNAEYRYPISAGFQAIFFVDSGSSWSSQYASLASGKYPQESSFRLHSSLGIGIRMKTPLGPIRLDYGVGDEGSRTHFSIGQVF